jgi:hypothetical protein
MFSSKSPYFILLLIVTIFIRVHLLNFFYHWNSEIKKKIFFYINFFCRLELDDFIRPILIINQHIYIEVILIKD